MQSNVSTGSLRSTKINFKILAFVAFVVITTVIITFVVSQHYEDSLSVTDAQQFTEARLPVASINDFANEDSGVLVNRDPSGPWIGNGRSVSGSWAGMYFRLASNANPNLIAKAEIEFYSSNDQWIALGTTFYGELSQNPASLTSANLLSKRTLTTNKVSYANNIRWEKGKRYRVDVTSVVKEVLTKQANTRGLVILVKGTGGAAWGRKFIGINGDQAPTLVMTVAGSTSTVSSSRPSSSISTTTSASSSSTTRTSSSSSSSVSSTTSRPSSSSSASSTTSTVSSTTSSAAPVQSMTFYCNYVSNIDGQFVETDPQLFWLGTGQNYQNSNLYLNCTGQNQQRVAANIRKATLSLKSAYTQQMDVRVSAYALKDFVSQNTDVAQANLGQYESLIINNKINENDTLDLNVTELMKANLTTLLNSNTVALIMRGTNEGSWYRYYFQPYLSGNSAILTIGY